MSFDDSFENTCVNSHSLHFYCKNISFLLKMFSTFNYNLSELKIYVSFGFRTKLLSMLKYSWFFKDSFVKILIFQTICKIQDFATANINFHFYNVSFYWVLLWVRKKSFPEHFLKRHKFWWIFENTLVKIKNFIARNINFHHKNFVSYLFFRCKNRQRIFNNERKIFSILRLNIKNFLSHRINVLPRNVSLMSRQSVISCPNNRQIPIRCINLLFESSAKMVVALFPIFI